MRTGSALVIPAILVVGCASMHAVTTPAVVPAKPAVITAIEPPAAPALDLDALDNPRIDSWERRLREHERLRQATEESLARGARYLPHLRGILADNGLPPSLALLPVVESGFRPRARGRAGERGLWQLRRATARRFGLVVNARRDDRLDVERATRAAARFLVLLRARYGDWALALAAYNAGERRVDRALARAPRADFWQLADRRLLPRISREYVPRFFAVVRIAEPESRSSRVAVDPLSMKLPESPPTPSSPRALDAGPLSFGARKVVAPQGQTSQASVTWSLGGSLGLQLSYLRCTLGRSVPHDIENGLLTSVKLAF